MAGDIAWQGRWIEVRIDGRWEYAARIGARGAAVILAITDARQILLVEQYRPAHGAFTIELPAGLIGDTGQEDDALAAAARELAEETGYTASDWQLVGDFATSPGMTSELFTLLKATGLVRSGPGGGVGGEAISVHVVPLAGIDDFLRAQRAAGRIIDSRLLLAMGLI
jgi:ADP-ribose pyrophosphatase